MYKNSSVFIAACSGIFLFGISLITLGSVATDLKLKYQPYEVNEDYLIETILIRGFETGRLRRQEAAHPIDFDKLEESWNSKGK